MPDTTLRHGLPPDISEDEAREDATPVVIPVLPAPGPGLDALYLGNLTAAENPAALAAHDITTTLNLAVNLFPGPLALPDGTVVRRYQLGLIDGPGNAPALLAAAVMLVDGLAAACPPCKPHYPPHRRGGLLVHCRGGRSRSVTVLALWLHLRRPREFPDLAGTIDHLRRLRGLGPDQPAPAMLNLAERALAGPLRALGRPAGRP